MFKVTQSRLPELPVDGNGGSIPDTGKARYTFHEDPGEVDVVATAALRAPLARSRAALGTEFAAFTEAHPVVARPDAEPPGGLLPAAQDALLDGARSVDTAGVFVRLREGPAGSAERVLFQPLIAATIIREGPRNVDLRKLANLTEVLPLTHRGSLDDLNGLEGVSAFNFGNAITRVDLFKVEDMGMSARVRGGKPGAGVNITFTRKDRTTRFETHTVPQRGDLVVEKAHADEVVSAEGHRPVSFAPPAPHTSLLGPNVCALAEGKPSPATMAALGALVTRLPGALASALEGQLQHLRENDLPKDMIGDPEEARMRAWRRPENQQPMRASQVIGSTSFLLGVAPALEKGSDALSDQALQKLAREAGAQRAAVGPYDREAYAKHFVIDKKKEPHLWALQKALRNALIEAETNDVQLPKLAKALTDGGERGAAFAELCATAFAEAGANTETDREKYFAVRARLI